MPRPPKFWVKTYGPHQHRKMSSNLDLVWSQYKICLLFPNFAICVWFVKVVFFLGGGERWNTLERLRSRRAWKKGEKWVKINP